MTARTLQERDAWIGWETATPKPTLDKMLCLSHFFIRPKQCRNLATRVLVLAIRCAKRDYWQRYRELLAALETFVDPVYSGAGFRAAGWRCIGQTSGRMRRGKSKVRNRSISDPWLEIGGRNWVCRRSFHWIGAATTGSKESFNEPILVISAASDG